MVSLPVPTVFDGLPLSVAASGDKIGDKSRQQDHFGITSPQFQSTRVWSRVTME